VDQGETGLIVPVRNANRLADAISALLEAPELRDRLGRAGRAKVQREFSDEKVVAETIGVYVASGVSVS
jgi:glycosyltransferase involved in cell wall biosynthesis